MKIGFANQRLALILTNRAHELGLPVAVVKSCRAKLNFIDGAPDERTLRNWKSLEFKKLEGSELRQVKLNDQFRMHFELDNDRSPPLVTVTFIGDPH